MKERFKASGFEYGGGWIIKSLGDNNDGSVNTIKVHCAEKRTSGRHKIYSFRNDIPVITQLLDNDEIDEYSKSYIRGLVYLLKQMRFLDVSPEAMRQPSLPGQTKLSSHSPLLLDFLTKSKRKYVSLVYRIPGRSHSSVIPVLKIPNAKKVLGKQAPWLIGLVF